MDTKLMTKLFSEDTSTEFKQLFNEKVEEAITNGSSELKDESNDLSLEKIDEESVKVLDGNSEVTIVSKNPDDKNDYVLDAGVEQVKIESNKTYSKKITKDNFKNFSEKSKAKLIKK